MVRESSEFEDLDDNQRGKIREVIAELQSKKIELLKKYMEIQTDIDKVVC